ncbi:helix-turn-helix domain-containing protein [Pedobacter fastidiosus]|uniref:AraC family transcriptional regulator n=1 Tax=Pedobacter fastidiosus TaxID=2765361 RepID=A0ABR7KXT2_9SPHI|nr:helix-turn-helix domain-containing protein [Pedobacter fastidiosus]MBC6112831.1 AraC family transcriptional regulator [Pedobacter fastidiosus]
MLFEFGLQSCLLLIFFFHILVYAFLFFRRSIKQENYADKLMGWFLIVAALLIIPFMVGFAGWYDNQPYRDILFFVPFVHSLFIGPLLCFYTKSIFNYSFRIDGLAWVHLMPGFVYLIVNVAISLIDIFIYKRYHLTNESEDPDFANWYTILSMLSVLIYLFLSIRYYNQYKKYTAIATSFADQASLKWLRNFLYAFFLLSIMPIIRTALSNFDFFERMRYFGPWYYYLGFAIVVYYIAINAFHAVHLPLHKIQFNPSLLVGFDTLETDAEIGVLNLGLEDQIPVVIDEKMLLLKKELMKLMEDSLLFERPDLTLSEVAKKLNTNSVILSRAVNQQFKLNFNDYINQYRVNAVVKRLAMPEFKNQTLLAIAFDAGFNSKATFNRSFKKFTGKNPKDFLNITS